MPVSSTPSSPSCSHHGSSLHIEVPTYDGDPLKWDVFETRFRAAIKARARGHSDLEIQGHLLKAVQHPLGQSLLHNMSSSKLDLDSMLDSLKERFGSPEVVAPLLIQNINKATQLGLNTFDLNNVHDHVVLSFQKLQSLVGDSLSVYLALIVVGMMSPECKREWLRHKSPRSVPDMDAITSFLKFWIKELAPGPGSVQPCLTSATSSSAAPATPPPSKFRPNPPLTPKKAPSGCPACKEQHGLLRCPMFQSYDVDRRNKLVRESRLCINCFSSQHGFRQCPSRFSCKTCNARHHTMLHKDRETVQSPPSTPAPVLSLTAATSPTIQSESRFLLTATLSLMNDGNTVRARAILDTGAAVSFMSEETASALKLERVHTPIQVAGTTGESHCKFSVTTKLHSHDLSFSSDPITFAVLPKIPTLQTPPNKKELLDCTTFRSYQLADPDLGGRVDLLLGVTDSLSLLTGETFKVNGLLAVPTQLGLCLSGPMLCSDPPPALMAMVPPTDLQDDLGRLWELDRVPEAPQWSAEDEAVLADFDRTHTRVDRRFSVSLPRMTNPPPVGDTRKQAVSRLLANERSLLAKDKLDAFHTVVREYLSLDHAEIVPPSELHSTPHCYLPVHGVFKETSTTTKVRAVFDASAKSSTGHSLNDTLLAGPNLYPPLTDVLIRFRYHGVAMSADISKMFREVLLNPEEKDWHRFLMRGTSGQILDCRMKRLTFGVKSSPFLATHVLRTLARQHSSDFPAASAAILNSFYVDDLLASTDSLDSAIQLRSELSQLLSQSGMLLRKWRSNSSKLLNSIPPDLHEDNSQVSISPPSQAHKALGLHWDTVCDNLHIAVPSLSVSPGPVTKRMIAARTAGVFDVLGLFSPTVVLARCIFQQTWKLGLSWDSPVPEDIQQHWDTWLSDLPTLHNHPVPRRLSPLSDSVISTSSLHGFCDASTMAYGAAVYLRTVFADGFVSVTLVSTKARVLPVRPVTIPKAELLGAHLLARITCHIADLLAIPLDSCQMWTDSEIVLHWLPKAPPLLDRFVANRVHAIQQLTPARLWKHVCSGDNPADLASRGMRAPDLISSALWWSGPVWLRLPPSQWPSKPPSKPSIPALTASIKPCLQLPQHTIRFLHQLWDKYSSFFLLVRVVGWIRRFRSNACLPPERRILGPLSYEDIVAAKSCIYKLAQLEFFPEAFPAAVSSSHLPGSHPLGKLLLSISPEGHLLVCSRVRDPESPTQPSTLIPLSAHSGLTKLLVRTLHRTYSHAGVSAMLSILVVSFYIPNLRNLLKQVSRACVLCQRAYARPLHHLMGMLPTSRTTPAPPFSRTGVDFAGPFTLRVGHTRKPSFVKTYAVVFICLTTKAVHLDLASSLSTTDFLAVLHRFVARRGLPSVVYSDNGSNFVGTREEIRQLQRFAESSEHKQAISHFASVHGIEWKHIPPRAPHFGGLWEAAVKGMKSHLAKNVTPHALRWDELYSVLTEAEAILNSRPLAPLHSSEATEGSFLTAAHFLVGRPLYAMPSRPASTSPTSGV